MSEYSLNFSPISTEETGTFKLLELPPELTALIEDAIKNSDPPSLYVKGNATEDAVLCTRDKTYTIRSVNLSNTVLVVTAPEDASHSLELAGRDDTVVIRDQVNEILELAPVVPKIQKLITRIRSREYGEDEEEDDETQMFSETRFTYEQAREEIQASDVELDAALKQRRILIINRELRPISPAYLQSILELILNLLVSLSQPHTNASVEALTGALSDDHEISRVVSTQVLQWFGVLSTKNESIDMVDTERKGRSSRRRFLREWKTVVGDTFADKVSMSLISANYLEEKSGFMGDEEVSLVYFPSSALPSEPAARFADLFLTRTKWKADEISTFLNDIAVNNKERDKLLLKYCRAITEGGVVMYTARAQYNG